MSVAKRDPAWGTVLLLGLGGTWVEAMGDALLPPVDADETRSSKSCTAALCEAPGGFSRIAARGYRGWQAVLSIGQLMLTPPESPKSKSTR